MSANILAFPHATPPIQPIAHFIRIGEAHKRLSDLHAAGRQARERYHESRADGGPRARAVSPRKQNSLTGLENRK